MLWGCCEKQTANEANCVPDMSCGFESCLLLDRLQSIQLQASPSGQVAYERLAHFNVHSLDGHELTKCVRARAISMLLNYISPVFSRCLVIYHHKSQIHVSEPLRGQAALTDHQRSSRVLTVFTWVKQHLPWKERERERCTWIREFLMTRLTSSLHSATSGLWSSRLDEKASKWDRKYSAVKKKKSM